MKNNNYEERKMIRTLDNIRLYDELMPAIRAAAIAQGGAERMLKMSEVLASLKLIESLDSKKDEVSLKASIEILNRTTGKPVERTLNIYGDISKLNERDLDAQILRAIDKSGATQLIDAAASSKAIKVRKPRRPRKNPLLVDPTPEGQA